MGCIDMDLEFNAVFGALILEGLHLFFGSEDIIPLLINLGALGEHLQKIVESNTTTKQH